MRPRRLSRRGSASSGLPDRTFWSRLCNSSGKVGKTNLHSHSSVDGFWMVLSGRVRFYGEDDVVLGEFGKHEGVMIPRNFKYWFESVGSEPLELLQVEARVAGKTADRIDHSERKLGQVVNAEAGPGSQN